jgi:hypothetical protein
VVEIGGHIVEFHDDAVTAYVEVLVVKRLVDVSYDWEREDESDELGVELTVDDEL